MPAKRIPACAQPLERFGDNDLAVTKLTTAARIRKVEHASRRARTRKPVRAFSHALRACHDYIVTPARVLTAALLFLPLATTACPIGWTPPPTNATWGPRCYLIPLPSALPHSSAAWTCAQSMGAYPTASARRRRMPS